MSNNRGCNPINGCLVTIVGGFVITVLLIGAVDNCDGISKAASKRASEGLMQLFMWGSFWVVVLTLFSKD
ncbi:hypothetical protein [Pseudocnuella soli]|uniref:hypothetical protein n=1 Tax=Pseudocnuella soli TaxID=2502779 RepID=UPI00104E8AA5|nr:hypothetical protein [Pseudocnuella soli]